MPRLSRSHPARDRFRRRRPARRESEISRHRPRLPPVRQVDDGLQAAPQGASTSGTGRRMVARPVNPLSTIRPERRNVLFGKVESSVAGEPEEEVRIIVSSRTNRGIRHEGMSDAYGRFAIKLSEGDWTVNVTMPSGRIYAVSQITSTTVESSISARDARSRA